ncbi:MAG: PHP domain-containing protein [Treponema sp.]|nr:PHP domain-containing protein [Treponema sp.]
MIVRADLHLHSCVSPCGDLLMSPRQIVKTLKEKHIALAALTDHNVAFNCPAFAACCNEVGIAALYGMEAQTAEEIHVLCLFPELQTALDFCTAWYETLPNVMNKPEVTGDQVYVNERDEIIGEVEKYLITSAPYALDECADRVHKAGGLVIPAHVDRPAFSMTSQLGAIVAGDWDALEFVRPHILQEHAQQSVATLPIALPAPYAITTSSDAHYVEHIGRRAFELDIGDEPLVTGSGSVNLAAVRAGLEKRVVHP